MVFILHRVSRGKDMDMEGEINASGLGSASWPAPRRLQLGEKVESTFKRTRGKKYRESVRWGKSKFSSSVLGLPPIPRAPAGERWFVQGLFKVEWSGHGLFPLPQEEPWEVFYSQSLFIRHSVIALFIQEFVPFMLPNHSIWSSCPTLSPGVFWQWELQEDVQTRYFICIKFQSRETD